MAQGRKTGGRQKGTPNKKNAELIAKAEAAGVLPLDVMLMDMREKLETGDVSGAADRARDAAPYLHAKLTSTEAKITGEMTHRDAVDRPPAETREEWLARRARDLRMVTPAGSAD